MAEFSAQAIARSINIVLKKASAKLQREVTLGWKAACNDHANQPTQAPVYFEMRKIAEASRVKHGLRSLSVAA